MAKNVAIRWTTQPRLSVVHAAYVVATGGRCVDAKLESALVTPVTDINHRLLSASIDVGRFWRRLVCEVAGDRTDSARADARATDIALMSAGMSELQLEQTSAAITRQLRECRVAFAQRYPKLDEQLQLRSRPLKERWDAFGPGLLRSIARRIWDASPPTDWWPPTVSGMLLQPVRGGGGGFDSDSSRFWIEAMLTDADPAVPEVLRVAYLVTRMAIESHTREKSSEHPHTLPWSFAAVPLVLSAAADLELVPAKPLPINAALDQWHIGDQQTAAIVQDWWQQLAGTPTAMPVALKALDRMLQPTRSASTDRPAMKPRAPKHPPTGPAVTRSRSKLPGRRVFGDRDRRDDDA